jgi:hypothetical protein
VSSTAGPDRLADKRQLTVVLRLVLDAHGGLVHGEAVEGMSGSIHRFSQWEEIVGAVRTVAASGRPRRDVT